jgi:exopolysaccharide biosynthesis operon protein EpsL
MRIRWRGLAAAAVGLLPPMAQADAGDVVNYSLGATVTRDANLFRLAPGVDPQTAIGSSDTGDSVTTTTVGVTADKQIGIQRLKLDMQLSSSRYGKFRRLDNDGHNLSGNWAWAVGSRVRGDLSASRKTALSGFDESASTSRNINTTTATGASVNLKLAADWEAFGVLNRNNSVNSAADRQAAAADSRSVETGIRYTAPAGHQLSLRQRRARSALVREDGVNAGAVWVASGLTRLSGDIGRTRRQTEGSTAGDSSGATGRLGLDWTLTPKTQLNMSVRQEVSAAASNFSATNTVRGASLGASWAPTATTSLQFSLDRSSILYGNDPTVAFTGREDRLRNIGLTLSYRPHRSLNLSLALRDEARDSNLAAFIYRDRLATVSAQFSF